MHRLKTFEGFKNTAQCIALYKHNLTIANMFSSSQVIVSMLSEVKILIITKLRKKTTKRKHFKMLLEKILFLNEQFYYLFFRLFLREKRIRKLVQIASCFNKLSRDRSIYLPERNRNSGLIKENLK